MIALADIDIETCSLIIDCLDPRVRLPAIILTEEQDPVIVYRYEHPLVGAVPGLWSVVVLAGDFTGMTLIECVQLDEAVVVCDGLQLNYIVAF